MTEGLGDCDGLRNDKLFVLRVPGNSDKLGSFVNWVESIIKRNFEENV